MRYLFENVKVEAEVIEDEKLVAIAGERLQELKSVGSTIQSNLGKVGMILWDVEENFRINPMTQLWDARKGFSQAIQGKINWYVIDDLVDFIHKLKQDRVVNCTSHDLI